MACFRRWHVGLVLHSLRNLQWLSRRHRIWLQRSCCKLLQHHALDCHSWLEYLPIGLFVWLLAWSRGSGLPQRDLQHRRLRQQDRFRAGVQPRVTLRARERLCWVEQARSEGVLRLLSAMHFFFSDFLELPFCLVSMAAAVCYGCLSLV